MESKGFREDASRDDVIRIYVDYSGREKEEKGHIENYSR